MDPEPEEAGTQESAKGIPEGALCTWCRCGRIHRRQGFVRACSPCVASVPQAFYGNESCEENIESDEGGEIYIEYGECEEVEINDYATHAIDFSEEVHPNRLDQVWHHDDSNQCCDGGAHVDRLGR
jgi:hypothetical protein